jgi:hypothetical protein
MRARATSAVVFLSFFLAATFACGGRTVATVTPAPLTRAQLAELRVDPGSKPRDLFWGVGGRRYAPPPKATYTFEEKDTGGFSVSYDVKSPDGVEWSAKIGPEAQTEVVVSRILWGVGYHQPPVYYLPSWTLSGDGEDPQRAGAPRKESEARFRPKLPQLDRRPEIWSWAENPFSGTRELKGLLVILLMLNSTDLKDDNNSIYAPRTRWDGARRWFVVRDVGAALGETGKLFPRRNWLQGFEHQGFITRLAGGRVEFDYDGRHQDLLTMISPADVQWRDAFRAANYGTADSARYIRRIKEKIADGRALRVDRRESAGTR